MPATYGKEKTLLSRALPAPVAGSHVATGKTSLEWKRGHLAL